MGSHGAKGMGRSGREPFVISWISTSPAYPSRENAWNRNTRDRKLYFRFAFTGELTALNGGCTEKRNTGYCSGAKYEIFV